jgi:hypothetical protein
MTGLAHRIILKWMLKKYGVDLIQLAQDRYQRRGLNCVTIVYKPIIQNQTLTFLSLYCDINEDGSDVPRASLCSFQLSRGINTH